MPSSPTVTDVQICTNALNRLGAKGISSFTDGTDRATACGNIYPFVKDNLLSLHDWKFIIRKQQLARKGTAPISGYSYEYQLPANRLTDTAVIVYDSNAAGSAAFKDFEIIADGLLTEAAEIWVDYPANNFAEAVWPPYVVELQTVAMMAELAMPITDQSGYAAKLYERVYGTPVENGRGGMMGRAIARNSREDPPQVFNDFSLVLARSEGQ